MGIGKLAGSKRPCVKMGVAPLTPISNASDVLRFEVLSIAERQLSLSSRHAHILRLARQIATP